MDAVITEVAGEGKRLIDQAWLGRITRDQAVHRFVQVGDGLVELDTAEDIVDDGLAWLDSHSTRLRLVRWCSVVELPVFTGLAVIGVALGEYPIAGIAVALLIALQYVHRRFTPHASMLWRRPRARR